MRIKQAVSMIPYGLLAGIVDGREVRITELGENGFVFRMAERVDKIQEISLQFYVESENCYRKIELGQSSEKSRKTEVFYRIYSTDRSRRISKVCTTAAFRLLEVYIFENDGNGWRSGGMVYRVSSKQDDEYASCLEEQKAEWFCEASKTANGRKTGRRSGTGGRIGYPAIV